MAKATKSNPEKISDEECQKRQRNYEFAKQESLKRGVELTPETEALMKRHINGEISNKVFFAVIWKMMLPPTVTH